MAGKKVRQRVGATERSADVELILAALEPMRPSIDRVLSVIQRRPTTVALIIAELGLSKTLVRNHVRALADEGKVGIFIARNNVGEFKRGDRVIVGR